MRALPCAYFRLVTQEQAAAAATAAAAVPSTTLATSTTGGETTNVVRLCMEGQQYIESKREHFSLMYMNFCPYHAHCYHPQGSICDAWARYIDRRQKATAAVKAQGAEKDAKEVEAIVAGGVPEDEKMAGLVVAAKYAMAHKGIFLEREKKHLAMLGIEGDKLIEITFAVGQMSALNMLYIHLISEGVDVEDFLQGAGPFKKTVYKEALAKAEL